MIIGLKVLSGSDRKLDYQKFPSATESGNPQNFENPISVTFKNTTLFLSMEIGFRVVYDIVHELWSNGSSGRSK